MVLDVLNFGMDLCSAIMYPRIHHQLYPNKVTVEMDFPPEFQKGLRDRGHDVEEDPAPTVAQGIFIKHGAIQAFSDYRKGGRAAGY